MPRGDSSQGAAGAHDAPDDPNAIDLDAIAQLGPPSEPRAESKVETAVDWVEAWVLVGLLVTWEIIVLVEVLIRASDSHDAVATLVIGAIAAAIGAPIAMGSIRSKQSVQAQGIEPARFFGVTWSTRWLLVGLGCMAIGLGAICSVR